MINVYSSDLKVDIAMFCRFFLEFLELCGKSDETLTEPSDWSKVSAKASDWLVAEVWPQTRVTCPDVLCGDHRVQHWRQEKHLLLLSSGNLEKWHLHNILFEYFILCTSSGMSIFFLISNLKSVNIAQTHVASISTSQTETGYIWFWICWCENVQILFPSQVTGRQASMYDFIHVTFVTYILFMYRI